MFILGALFLLSAQKIWQLTFSCAPHLYLINPAVACSSLPSGLSEWDYDPLRQDLADKISNYTESGVVPHIALYFRDLKNGSRFAIRETEIFEPVSLLKLPIMVVILNEADRRPEFLDERLTYKKESSYRFITGPLENTLRLNSSYSVRELLEKMIRYSDNSSTNLLLEKINDLKLQEKSNTFADFGTMQLLTSGQLDNTRLISLVNVFVALYNANYLTPASSQFALQLLTTTNFDSGIVSGTPKDIPVAHKYGMRIGDTKTENELHDCGIVYHRSSPYVLCVLTAGADFDAASAAIRDISRLVYEHVEALKK